MRPLYFLTAALTVFGSASQAQPVQRTNAPVAERPDMTIYRLQPDLGGKPNDGVLWRASETSTLPNAAPGSTLTVDIVANTPIPDTEQNREQFGEPLSKSGQLTAPKPGPTS